MIDDTFYAISDDTLSLTRFSKDGDESHIPLLSGELPKDERERKKVKPDFESLFISEERLIILGSGSTSERDKGVAMPIRGDSLGSPETFSLTPLYSQLREKIVGLNIEGALSIGEKTLLAHRGNTTGSIQAVIFTKADEVLAIHDLSTELPDGYGFTDLAADPENPAHVWFLAVKEETENAYEDGAFCGAMLGQLLLSDDQPPKVGRLQLLEIDTKPEGLWIKAELGGKRSAYLVTDADSPLCPSLLYHFSFEAP